jgi:hypothetical protein
MFKATKAAVIEVNSDRIAIFRCLYRNNRSLNASYWTYSCIFNDSIDSINCTELYDQSIEEVEKQPFIHIGAVI